MSNVDLVDDVDDDLDEYLAAGSDVDLEGLDVKTAMDRLLRRIRRTEREMEADREHVRRNTDAMREWLTRRAEVHAGKAQWAKRSLETLMRQHFAATGVKTVKLPSGEVRIRPADVRIGDVDDQQVSTWADAHGVGDALVSWEPSISAATIKSWCLPFQVLSVSDDGAAELCTAGFVPAAVVPYVVPFAAGWCVLDVEVPSVTLWRPTQRNFGYTTAKDER